jgi:hypothetical protein
MDSAFQRVDTLPTVAFVSPADVCEGTPNFALTSGTPSGGLYIGTGVNAGNFFSSISGIGKFGITYIFVDANGCQGRSVDSIEVFAKPNATFAALNNLCEDAASITLNTGAPAGGVYFGTGVSSGSFDPSITGAGTFTLGYGYTDVNACSDTAYRSITVDTLPTVSFGVLNPVCEDAMPVALSGGNPAGGAYSGSGVTGTQFDPATTGTGTFTLTYSYTDANGCSNQATSAMEVIALPTFDLGNDTSLCPKQSLTLDPGQAGMIYLWSNGDTTQTLAVKAAGAYHLLITDPSSTAMCSYSDTISVDFTEVCTGFEEDKAGAVIRVYPNPNNGRFILKISGNNAANKIVILDVRGRLMQSFDIRNEGKETVYSIDISEYENGMYYLQISGNNFMEVHRITISK